MSDADEMTMKASLQSDAASTATFALEMDGVAVETVSVQALSWDSDILGMRCAALREIKVCQDLDLGNRPNVSTSIDRYVPLMRELEKAGMEYVTVRRPQCEWTRIHALEYAGFRMVDGIIDFQEPVKAEAEEPTFAAWNFRRATPDDAVNAARLAPRIFKMSRFHNDPLLTAAQAERVHGEWVKNSCLGEAADAVWLAETKVGLLGGFVTCRLEGEYRGRIVLIGVDPSHAGKGLGSGLVRRALMWFGEKGCKIVSVQTQTDNFAAIRLYTKCGLDPVSSYVTLRWSARESRS